MNVLFGSWSIGVTELHGLKSEIKKITHWYSQFCKVHFKTIDKPFKVSREKILYCNIGYFTWFKKSKWEINSFINDMYVDFFMLNKNVNLKTYVSKHMTFEESGLRHSPCSVLHLGNSQHIVWAQTGVLWQKLVASFLLKLNGINSFNA